jgi:hypothetical protein
MNEKIEQFKEWCNRHPYLVTASINSLITMSILYTGKYIEDKILERKLSKMLSDMFSTGCYPEVTNLTGKQFLKWIKNY